MENEIKQTPERHITLDTHEHVVDINKPEVKQEIEKAKTLFKEFSRRYEEQFDLADESSISKLYGTAKEMKIFEEAQKIRELIYGKNISFYGVCYLSNRCNQNCDYCPMGQAGRDIWEAQERIAGLDKLIKEQTLHREEIERSLYKSWSPSQEEKDKAHEETIDGMKFIQEQSKQYIAKLEKGFKKLTPEEASEDMEALREIGHQEICLLSGEDVNAAELIDYLQIALNKGFKEVILNIGSFSEREFRKIRQNLKIPKGVILQHRVFQETFDRKTYDLVHRYAPKGERSKRNFDLRLLSQIAALKAGFDEVGIGVLFGLTRYPLKEIAGLQKQAEEIKKETGKEPKRCALPLTNKPKISYVRIPYFIPGMKYYQEIAELIYASARLALPTISIISSERDPPHILKKLLKNSSNHCTLGVAPTPGGNVETLKKLKEGVIQEEKLIPQANVFSQNPAEALKELREEGYNILGFDVEKYKN